MGWAIYSYSRLLFSLVWNYLHIIGTTTHRRTPSLVPFFLAESPMLHTSTILHSVCTFAHLTQQLSNSGFFHNTHTQTCRTSSSFPWIVCGSSKQHFFFCVNLSFIMNLLESSNKKEFLPSQDVVILLTNLRSESIAITMTTKKKYGLLYTMSQGPMFNPNQAFLLVQKLKSAPQGLYTNL